ncbi:MAG TPA: cytochrome b N-terminal domain-containing protein [Enhygromyxa sp.]|nr:cytochrome b N-terminal domain-containing protein [Enhygromyxa sp.]
MKDRFGLQYIQQHVLDRRIPKTSWYQGDGAALLVLLATLVITGMCMAPTYTPSPDDAHASVAYITERQWLGWFVRGLHYWSAGLMVVMVLAHLFRQILVAGYKFPREGTWLIGVMLLCLVITMGFIGYVLRWDQRAIYALRVALTMFWRVPAIGDDLVVFIQGGEAIGARTLPRLYAVHVIFVPLLLLSLVGWHIYLVIVHGVTSKAERRQPIASLDEHQRVYTEAKQSEHGGEDFHPTTTARTGASGFIVFMLALGLTLGLGPPALGPAANLVTPAFVAEEWYFAWYSGLIALLPPSVAPWFVVAFPLLVLAILIALPLVDRGPNRGFRRRPLAVVIVVAIVATMLFLTDLRRRSPWTGWPTPEPPSVPADVQLSPDAERGRQLFAAHGCTSCHAIAGRGRQVGPDLARISPPMSALELRRYILRPPEHVAMPDYQDMLSELELRQIVAFVLVAQTFEGEAQQR